MNIYNLGILKLILKTASLTPTLLRIIADKGTEKPNFNPSVESHRGTYLCRQCGLGLFQSQHKFISSCGWPSFDDNVPDTIQKQLDADGYRTEILCSRCQAHLGHVFTGEGFTAKNLRHCVNSASLDFVPFENIVDTEEAILAAGCFWGVEYLFKKLPGVVKAEVGYTGGQLKEPSYEMVCAGNTGHVEALRIVYDINQIDYEKIIQYFFEIHDPSQQNGQGPDIGEQYLSRIFYYDETQKAIASKLIATLQDKGVRIATTLSPVSTFWPAEGYHQNYYGKIGKLPYCHFYTKRF